MSVNTNRAGVYKLTCINNGKIYIGKSIDIDTRIKSHKISKRKGLLQRAIAKHGWDSFTVEILETVDNFDKLKDNDDLLNRESYYIELFDSTNLDKGYNICKFSTDNTGIPCSDEQKRKISESKKGHTISEETREKLRQAKLGKPNCRLGMKSSEETKQKLRRPRSEETKIKMSKAKLGKPLSEEHKEKLRVPKKTNGNLGKPRSQETKDKIKQTKLRNKQNI